MKIVIQFKQSVSCFCCYCWQSLWINLYKSERDLRILNFGLWQANGSELPDSSSLDWGLPSVLLSLCSDVCFTTPYDLAYYITLCMRHIKNFHLCKMQFGLFDFIKCDSCCRISQNGLSGVGGCHNRFNIPVQFSFVFPVELPNKSKSVIFGSNDFAGI